MADATSRRPVLYGWFTQSRVIYGQLTIPSGLRTVTREFARYMKSNMWESQALVQSLQVSGLVFQSTTH